MSKSIFLFTLQTFSTTGGIQKMTRTLGHALHQVATKNNWDFEMWSVYDKPADLADKYIPANNFKAFGNKKNNFLLKVIAMVKLPDVVILSHINMAIVGLFIKLFNPKCKVWLIAHGIEIWRPLSFIKVRFLKKCDKVICVSNYTMLQVTGRHNVNPCVCYVLNNAIDPFMILPQIFDKPQKLHERYMLEQNAHIIFSLTRLASTEQYKGYDQIIKALSNLKLKFPHIKYILAGQYDPEEEIRIKKLITQYGVEENTILTGFINEDELADHFLLADLFVLPSKKEGFGIVFIEAMACGLPVICGGADGSIDAIRNGELGEAINADDEHELASTIARHLDTPLTTFKRRHLQQKCLEYFNETEYISKLELLLH